MDRVRVQVYRFSRPEIQRGVWDGECAVATSATSSNSSPALTGVSGSEDDMRQVELDIFDVDRSGGIHEAELPVELGFQAAV